MIRRTVLALAMVSAACSSSAESPAPSKDVDAGGAGTLDDSGSAEDASDASRPKPPPCSQPPEERPPGGTCVLDAKGQVTDLGGASLADLLVTLCGRICFGTHTDASGQFDVPVGYFLDRENYALHVNARPDHADVYVRLVKGDAPVVTLASAIRVPLLPKTGALLPADGAAAARVTSGPITLAIADGTKFDLAIEDFGTGDVGRTMRAVEVPVDTAPDFAKAANVERVYALSPAGAKASLKMGVSVTNDGAIAAGTAIEIYLLGDDYLSTPPTVGVMSVAAQAHVSADGKTIDTDPGEGILQVQWIGIRRKGT